MQLRQAHQGRTRVKERLLTLMAKTNDTTEAVPHHMPAAEERPSLSTANKVLAMDNTKNAPEIRPQAVNTCQAMPGMSDKSSCQSVRA